MWTARRTTLLFAGMLLIGSMVDLRAEAAERAYSVQMHLHAHSNHNAGTMPASLQWHTAQARAAGTDVLWWSEHSSIFERADTLVVEPGLGILDEETFRVELEEPSSSGRPDRTAKRVNRIDPVTTTGVVSAEIRNGRLYARVHSAAEPPGRAEFVYRPTAGGGPIHASSFTRSLAGNVVLLLEVDCPDFGEGVERFVEIDLSWHYNARPVRYSLRYILSGSAEEESARVVGDSGVVVTMPCRRGGSEVRLDLSPAGALLPDGLDACVQDIRWGVVSSTGSNAEFGVGRIRLLSLSNDRLSYFDAVRSILDGYETAYEVLQKTGGEYSFPRVHLNAFFPDSSLSPDVLCLGNEMEDASEWVAAVHDRGGVVSYNHPFGAKMGLVSNQSDRSVRAIVRNLGMLLLEQRALGADVLEVGYVRRGYALDAHLRLWDYLTAHGLFLYGNGTSDSHGGLWFEGDHGNWYHTWVWAENASSEALLAGLKMGRVYFGDLHRWDGEFDFRIGEHRAGARIRVEEEPLSLRLLLRPVPEGASVRLVQGLIDPLTARVTYVHDGVEIDPEDPPRLDVSRSCFVRLEVYSEGDGGASGGGVPLLFSNPIVFTD